MERKTELIRTFIAVPFTLPGELAEQIVAWKQQFRDEHIRWVASGNAHLTLQFLGDIDSDQVEAVGTQLREHLGEEHARTLPCRGLGVFGLTGAPRVLWAGLEDETFLRGLHMRVKAATGEVLATSDTKPFRPHLTLARIKHMHDPARLMRKVQEFHETLFGDVCADQVFLYKSQLQPGGAKYTPLVQVRLGT